MSDHSRIGEETETSEVTNNQLKGTVYELSPKSRTKLVKLVVEKCVLKCFRMSSKTKYYGHRCPSFNFVHSVALKSLPKKALLMVNKGSCCSVSIPVSNTNSHDITIKKGSVLVTLKLISQL